VDKVTTIVSTLKRVVLELAEYFDNASLMVGVTAGVMALTLITYFLFKKIRIIKYLPGFIVLMIGLYNLNTVLDVLTAESSLPVLLLAVIGIVAGLVGMLFALVIGILAKPVKKKRRKSPRTASDNNVEQKGA
jgi:membrane associated rhomboid family serine protease